MANEMTIKLADSIKKAKSNMQGREFSCELERNFFFAEQLIADGVIVPPFEVGDEVWVVEREYGEAVDITCYIFLAKSKGCIIGTSRINDYNLDEIIEYHINETQENLDTDLVVYPEADCFATKEEAEKALKAGANNE